MHWEFLFIKLQTRRRMKKIEITNREKDPDQRVLTCNMIWEENHWLEIWRTEGWIEDGNFRMITEGYWVVTGKAYFLLKMAFSLYFVAIKCHLLILDQFFHKTSGILHLVTWSWSINTNYIDTIMSVKSIFAVLLTSEYSLSTQLLYISDKPFDVIRFFNVPKS